MSKKKSKRILTHKNRNALKGIYDGPGHLGFRRATSLNWGSGMTARSYRTQDSSNTEEDYNSEIEDPNLLLDR